MFQKQSNYQQIKNNLFSGNNNNTPSANNSSNPNTDKFNKGNDRNKHSQIFNTQNSNSNYAIMNQTPVKNVFDSKNLTTQIPTKNSGKSLFGGSSSVFTNASKSDAMMEDTRPQNNFNATRNFSDISGQRQQSGRNLFEKNSNIQPSIISINQPQSTSIATPNVFTNIFQSTNAVNVNSQSAFNPGNIFGSNNLLLTNTVSKQIDVSNSVNKNSNLFNNDSMMDDSDNLFHKLDDKINFDKENKVSQNVNTNMEVGEGHGVKNSGSLTMEQFEQEIRKEFNIIKII